MFNEIAKKIEEAFTYGIDLVKEDIISIKNHLIEIENRLFIQQGIQAPINDAVTIDVASAIAAPEASDNILPIIAATEVVSVTPIETVPVSEVPAD